MLRLKKETRDYLRDYVESLNASDNPYTELYLRVVDNALELAKNEDKFFELLSYGNSLVVEYSNKDPNHRRVKAQFKYDLKGKMLDELDTKRTETLYGLEYKKEPVDPYKVVETDEMLEAATKALYNLPIGPHVCFKEVVLNECTYTDVSKRFAITTDAVKKNIRRGNFLIQVDRDVAYLRHAEDPFMLEILENADKRREKEAKQKVR